MRGFEEEKRKLAQIDKSKRENITFAEYSLQSEKSFNWLDRICLFPNIKRNLRKNNFHHNLHFVRTEFTWDYSHWGWHNADETNRNPYIAFIFVFTFHAAYHRMLQYMILPFPQRNIWMILETINHFGNNQIWSKSIINWW